MEFLKSWNLDFKRKDKIFEYSDEVRLFFNESVINFDMPSAVFSAIFPENPSVTIT